MTGAEIAIVGLLIAGFGIDAWLAVKQGFQGTISWWVWTNSVKYPIIPFIFGIFMGHFFWDQSLNVTVQGGCSQ